MEISKTVFTFTVLHPTDETPETLEVALEESDTGNMVGWTTNVATTAVDPVALRGELLDLGNDGEFFNADDEN